MNTSPVVGTDGSIFFGGASGNSLRLVKLDANGTLLDEAFVSETGHALLLVDLALDPTGGLVGVGLRRNTTGGVTDPVVLKVSTETLEAAPAYGTSAGRTVISFRPGVDEIPHAVAVDATGRAYVVGETGGDTLVARLRPDGTLDPTFDANGGRDHDLGDRDRGTDALVTPVGTLLIGAVARDDHAVTAILPSSAIDTSFGDIGLALLPSPGAPASTSLARAADGRLLAGGITLPESSTRAVVGRLGSDGRVDATFGSAGLVTYDPSGSTSGAVVVDEAGRPLRGLREPLPRRPAVSVRALPRAGGDDGRPGYPAARFSIARSTAARPAAARDRCAGGSRQHAAEPASDGQEGAPRHAAPPSALRHLGDRRGVRPACGRCASRLAPPRADPCRRSPRAGACRERPSEHVRTRG